MNEPPLSAEDVQFNYSLNLFISGLLLSNNHSSIQRSALDVLNKSNAGFQLPLILFMLSKTSGEVQFALLNSLPSTAVDKVFYLYLLGELSCTKLMHIMQFIIK